VVTKQLENRKAKLGPNQPKNNRTNKGVTPAESLAQSAAALWIYDRFDALRVSRLRAASKSVNCVRLAFKHQLM
jgi:hypothetical protein